jgi:hypothetical protein
LREEKEDERVEKEFSAFNINNFIRSQSLPGLSHLRSSMTSPKTILLLSCYGVMSVEETLKVWR